ncbi:predicted protein [Uncinocarpus reesii 1704]|uniref:Uncharacterized protein n=1 Tax=Uncinocarpus reesii (strain UAMH 1704) TaxID=336963 RepID=C4JPW3_UNCRE|nr:uncharacterized protein UREG_04606 [Uncinocarpus reesii 1704]EEP79760.1 predicted protein [Uncinocarpus reesii 1704]
MENSMDMVQNEFDMSTGFDAEFNFPDISFLDDFHESLGQVPNGDAKGSPNIKNAPESESDAKDSHFDFAFEDIVHSRGEYKYDCGTGAGDDSHQYGGDQYGDSAGKFIGASFEGFGQCSYNEAEDTVAIEAGAFNGTLPLRLLPAKSPKRNMQAPASPTRFLAGTLDATSMSGPQVVFGVGSKAKPAEPEAVSQLAIPHNPKLERSKCLILNTGPSIERNTSAPEGTEVIALTFTSAAEANSYAPQKWSAPSVDLSVPKTQEGREAIVRSLMEAMYSLTESKDNDGMIRPWRDGRYCQPRVEIACWNIMERKTICKRLIDVPFFLNFIDDPSYQANRVEQNKGLNAKKGMVIKAGKDALEKEEKESGRTMIPAPRKRHRRYAAEEAVTPVSVPRICKRQRRGSTRSYGHAGIPSSHMGVATDGFTTPLPNPQLHTPPNSANSNVGSLPSHGPYNMPPGRAMREHPCAHFSRNPHGVIPSGEYGGDQSRAMPPHHLNPLATPKSEISRNSVGRHPRSTGNHAFSAYTRGFHAQEISSSHFTGTTPQTPQALTYALHAQGYTASNIPAPNMEIHGGQQHATQPNLSTSEGRTIGESESGCRHHSSLQSDMNLQAQHQACYPPYFTAFPNPHQDLEYLPMPPFPHNCHHSNAQESTNEPRRAIKRSPGDRA